MGTWTILGRKKAAVIQAGLEWDLLVVRIDYKTRSIINEYRIAPDERRIPKHLMKSRKFSTTTLDGKDWIEGTYRRRVQ